MNLPRGQTISKSVTRDGRAHEIGNEKRSPPNEESEPEVSGSRREFFNALIPASGKVFTGISRIVGTTLSTLVEDIRSPSAGADSKEESR